MATSELTLRGAHSPVLRLARPPLVGRRRERELLDQRLRAVRAGDSSALVVRGEPGIGKTALLEYATASAADLRILRAAGVESEMELPFAGLHQLCAPLLDGLDRLPGPQRVALATAFGLREGAVPDRLFVGLAVLSLLADVAGERPLVCVIDDAQWLDHASAQALGLVARRLLAESVLMLFAAREPGEALRGLPELVVEGLPESDARELLRSVVPGALDARVGDRIVAETRGNPLALLELPRGLTPTQLAGGFGLPAPSLAGRLEEQFAHAARRPAGGHATARVAGGRGARRRSGARVARGRPARDQRRGARAGRARRAPGDRRRRAVPPPARALGRLRRGVTGRAARGAPGAGRGDRRRDRSRPPRVARGPGNGRPGRGRRRRARTPCRPRAGPRRPRGGGRVPGAGGRADARSVPARAARAGGGADVIRSGRARPGASPARHDRGRGPRRAPARAGPAPARPDRVRRPARRRRTDAAARTRRASWSPSIRRSHARPTWRRSPRRCSPAGWPAAAARWR